MKIIRYIFVFLLLTSCTEQKEEVVDMSDITPQSKRNYDQVDDSNNDEDSTTEIKNRFIANGIEVDSLSFSINKLFPDRVGPLSSEKYVLTTADETIEYYLWSFVDSAKTINSFYNWIDMFKVDRVGDEVSFQKDPMCILVGDTNLIYISGSAKKIDEWLDYHEALGYDKEWNYLVQQMLGGRVRWYNFEDGKKTRLKNEAL